jgi:hypothetical protein
MVGLVIVDDRESFMMHAGRAESDNFGIWLGVPAVAAMHKRVAHPPHFSHHLVQGDEQILGYAWRLKKHTTARWRAAVAPASKPIRRPGKNTAGTAAP